MLSRIGKCLILVTVAATVVLVLSRETVPAAPPTDHPPVFMGEGGQIGALVIVLGSSAALVSILLTMFAMRGRSVASGSGQADSIRSFPRSALGTYREVQHADTSSLDASSLGAYLPGVRPLKATWAGDVEHSLVGNTLRAYWSVLCRRHGSIGLRELQREIGFSSPSSAVYQLEKLVKLGLVEKDSMGDYLARKVVKVGFLRSFFFVRGYPLPKSSIFGALTLLVEAVCFATLVDLQIQIQVAFLALLPGLFSSSVFWYDATKVLKYKESLFEMKPTKHG